MSRSHNRGSASGCKPWAAGIATFVIAWWFFWFLLVPIGDRYLPLMLGYRLTMIVSNPFVMLAIISVCALTCALVAFQCVNRRVNVAFITAVSWLYVIAAVAAIMLKSRGVQAVNFNPGGIVGQLQYSPAVVLFNILVFVPMGLMAYSLHNAGVAYGTAIGVIVAMEVGQYAFHLGVCDIDGVIANLVGFTMGYLAMSLWRRSRSVEREGAWYVIGGASKKGDGKA